MGAPNGAPTQHLLTGSSIAAFLRTPTISSPSALSFLLIRTSLPIHGRRVATALPRMTRCTGCAAAMSEPSPRPPLALPHEFLLRPRSHTTALDPCEGPRIRANARSLRMPLTLFAGFGPTNKRATFTWLTTPCTELPNPEAAVLPTLVSVFDFEVTLLEPVTTQSV